MGSIIGVDIGGTKIRLGVISKTKKVLKDVTIPTKIPVYPYLENEIQKLLAEFPNVIGIGIGTRGMVDYERGIILYEKELEGWEGTEVKSQLEAATKIRVEVNNDANCAALAEAKLGAGKAFDHVICLTIGTCLGGGFVFDGKVMNGAHGGAGEVGHLILYPHGLQCGCGRKGCSEQYVSGTAIRRLIAEKRVIDPVTNAFVTPQQLFRLAANGQRNAVEVRERFLTDLSFVISNLQAVLDIDCVVIGGGVSESANDWWDLLIEKVNPLKLQPLEIRRAIFGNESGMLGAALLVQD
ncbi:ROK family protein [Rummeliibacillus sp. NPDC094406]|uniref:ROK family protein n=1 Tax=Rummeliibacillus sp. NPDC094406 TaxID=3364511 RepID=UPI0038214EA5